MESFPIPQSFAGVFMDKCDVEIFVQLKSRQCHTGVSPLTLDAINMKPQFLLSQNYITFYDSFLRHGNCCNVSSFQRAFSESSKDAIPNPYPVRSPGFFEGTNGKGFSK